MENQSNDIMSEVLKFLGGGAGGTIIGYFAQKRAAKSEAVSEMKMLKTEYKEFADYTRKELNISREDRKECQERNEKLQGVVDVLKTEVNDLTLAIHNTIGTPKDKQKGLNK